VQKDTSVFRALKSQCPTIISKEDYVMLETTAPVVKNSLAQLGHLAQ